MQAQSEQLNTSANEEHQEGELTPERDTSTLKRPSRQHGKKEVRLEEDQLITIQLAADMSKINSL